MRTPCVARFCEGSFGSFSTGIWRVLRLQVSVGIYGNGNYRRRGHTINASGSTSGLDVRAHSLIHR